MSKSKGEITVPDRPERHSIFDLMIPLETSMRNNRWSDVILLGGSNTNSWFVITPSYRPSINHSLILNINDSDSSISENIVALPVSEPERRPNAVQNPQEIIIDEEIMLPIHP